MRRERRIEDVRRAKLFRPLDLIVYAIVAVAVFLLFSVAAIDRGQPQKVEIYYQNTLYKTLTLATDDDYNVVDSDGKVLLRVVIDNGTVRVHESVCPDHVCEASAIKSVGQTIVCLPNAIVISIVSEEDNVPDLGV